MKETKTVDIRDVQPGDVFVEAPELGPVTNIDPHLYGQEPGTYVKVWTRDEPMDRWGAPQQVEVLRES